MNELSVQTTGRTEEPTQQRAKEEKGPFRERAEIEPVACTARTPAAGVRTIDTIAAEINGWARLGYRKVLCIQPFACLPGHIFGKGQYAALQRKLPQARLVSVDYDASTGEGTVQSRVRMLLDESMEPLF